MSQAKKKLLIDTDAGVDDAHAILLALRSPDVDVIGITCVAGNTNANQVGLNVLRILQVVNRLDIPVYVGCNEPLLGDTKATSSYHGFDGFGDSPDPNAPDAKSIQSEHAVAALTRLSKQFYGQLTLVCIGPLTNVAMAIRMDSSFGCRLKNCFIMGGNHQGKGNMTPAAEFNFYFDPEAAYVTLNQLKAPITLVTWETCEAHSLSWEWFLQFHHSNTKVGRFLYNIERQTVQTWYKRYFDMGISKKYEVVDQLAMAAAIFDDVIDKYVTAYATVETKSPVSFGQLVVDWTDMLGLQKNVSIVLAFKTTDFYRQLRSSFNTITQFLKKIEKYSADYAMKNQWGNFVPADEVLIACLLHDDIIKSRCEVYATVEIKGQYTWGQMVVDWNKTLGKENNVTIVTDIDQNHYETMLLGLQI